MQDDSLTIGRLICVAVPIGNTGDISERALASLRACDVLLIEEWKVGSGFCRRFNIDTELIAYNEHTRDDELPEVIRLLQSGKTVCLISDQGTPVFSDPGLELVQACYAADIPVTTVPGASSLMAALTLCGFPVDRFRSLGWLPRNERERESELKRLVNEPDTSVIMETPYRLSNLLDSLANVLPAHRMVAVCLDLTMKSEEVVRGPISKVRRQLTGIKKRVFVCVVAGTQFVNGVYGKDPSMKSG